MLGGQVPPPWPPPPSRSHLEGPAPLAPSPINSGGWEGNRTPSPGAALPPSYTFSSSVALSEALPENYELHRHHVVVLPELSLNFSSPLLHQEGGDVPGPYVC